MRAFLMRCLALVLLLALLAVRCCAALTLVPVAADVRDMALTLGSDGRAMFIYQQFNDAEVLVVRCADSGCDTTTGPPLSIPTTSTIAWSNPRTSGLNVAMYETSSISVSVIVGELLEYHACQFDLSNCFATKQFVNSTGIPSGRALDAAMTVYFGITLTRALFSVATEDGDIVVQICDGLNCQFPSDKRLRVWVGGEQLTCDSSAVAVHPVTDIPIIIGRCSSGMLPPLLIYYICPDGVCDVASNPEVDVIDQVLDEAPQAIGASPSVVFAGSQLKPTVSSYDSQGFVRVRACESDNCNSTTDPYLSMPPSGLWARMAVSGNLSLPLLAFYSDSLSHSDVVVMWCYDPDCRGQRFMQVVANTTRVEPNSTFPHTLALAVDSNGVAHVSFIRDLKLLYLTVPPPTNWPPVTLSQTPSVTPTPSQTSSMTSSITPTFSPTASQTPSQSRTPSATLPAICGGSAPFCPASIGTSVCDPLTGRWVVNCSSAVQANVTIRGDVVIVGDLQLTGGTVTVVVDTQGNNGVTFVDGQLTLSDTSIDVQVTSLSLGDTEYLIFNTTGGIVGDANVTTNTSGVPAADLECRRVSSSSRKSADGRSLSAIVSVSEDTESEGCASGGGGGDDDSFPLWAAIVIPVVCCCCCLIVIVVVVVVAVFVPRGSRLFNQETEVDENRLSTSSQRRSRGSRSRGSGGSTASETF